MSLIVGLVPYPVVPGTKPVVGDSPAIAVGAYPLGTPLSLTPVRGRRFNLIGKKSNGDDNAADVFIGDSGAVGATPSKSAKKPIRIQPGHDGMVALYAPDNTVINLADYYATGTDGDGVRYIKID